MIGIGKKDLKTQILCRNKQSYTLSFTGTCDSTAVNQKGEKQFRKMLFQELQFLYTI